MNSKGSFIIYLVPEYQTEVVKVQNMIVTIEVKSPSNHGCGNKIIGLKKKNLGITELNVTSNRRGDFKRK